MIVWRAGPGIRTRPAPQPEHCSCRVHAQYRHCTAHQSPIHVWMLLWCPRTRPRGHGPSQRDQPLLVHRGFSVRGWTTPRSAMPWRRRHSCVWRCWRRRARCVAVGGRGDVSAQSL